MNPFEGRQGRGEMIREPEVHAGPGGDGAIAIRLICTWDIRAPVGWTVILADAVFAVLFNDVGISLL